MDRRVWRRSCGQGWLFVFGANGLMQLLAGFRLVSTVLQAGYLRQSSYRYYLLPLLQLTQARGLLSVVAAMQLLCLSFCAAALR